MFVFLSIHETLRIICQTQSLKASRYVPPYGPFQYLTVRKTYISAILILTSFTIIAIVFIGKFITYYIYGFSKMDRLCKGEIRFLIIKRISCDLQYAMCTNLYYYYYYYYYYYCYYYYPVFLDTLCLGHWLDLSVNLV